MRRLVRTAVAVAISAGFYLLLIDTVSLPELIAMAGVLLVCGFVFWVSREHRVAEPRGKLSWLARAWRPIAQVPGQIVIVSWDAIAQLASPRRVRGRFRAVGFAGGESGADRGRRALTEALGSLAPNTIVVGVDAERDLLLVHQLRRSGDAEELDVLRLG